MNNLLEQFKEKVLSTDESFTIKTKSYGYCFLLNKVNDVKLIYGSKSLRGTYFYIDRDIKYELSAIIKDKKIYLIDRYFFDIWSNDYDKINELNDSDIYLFDMYKKELYQNILDTTFRRFYDDLEYSNVNEISESILKNVKRDVKMEILYNKDYSQNIDMEYNYSDYIYIKHLCGLEDIFKLTSKKLNTENEINKWTNKKTQIKATQYIRENIDKFFSENEINLYNTINELDKINCKKVNIEFELNGYVASEKIELEKIKFAIINNDNFDEFDFETRDKGKQLLRKLNINNYSDEKQLTYDKITRISYRGKDVFVRK